MQTKRRTTLNLANRQRIAISAFLVFLIDFISKTIALQTLSDRPVRIVGDLVKFHLRYNSGAAFSIGTSHTLIFSSLSIGALFLITYFGTRIKNGYWAVATGLALGGVAGNLSDRIFRPPGGLQGQVVDWIEIPHWPTFNLADTAIFSAAVMVILLTSRNVPPFDSQDRDDSHTKSDRLLPDEGEN